MKIFRKTAIKQVVTEKSKEKLKMRFHSKKAQLEREVQQLSFEQRKLLNKKGVSKEDVKRRFSKEIERRHDQLKWVDYQLGQLNIIPLGSELVEDEYDTLVEVNEGDNWEDIMEKKSIIIEDGVVIRIE